MSEPLYNAKQVLGLIKYMCDKYLHSSQFNLKILEEEPDGEYTHHSVSMSEFMTKMVAAELVEAGASAAHVTQALKEIEAPPITHPNEKSVSLVAYSPVYISDGRSKIRAER